MTIVSCYLFTIIHLIKPQQIPRSWIPLFIKPQQGLYYMTCAINGSIICICCRELLITWANNLIQLISLSSSSIMLLPKKKKTVTIKLSGVSLMATVRFLFQQKKKMVYQEKY